LLFDFAQKNFGDNDNLPSSFAGIPIYHMSFGHDGRLDFDMFLSASSTKSHYQMADSRNF
jgi:hypothetical protein